jgi:hypothetical protein
MSDEAPVCQIHRDENNEVFLLIDGVKIAKRGLPDTPHADTWIMLEPGWMVRDVKGGTATKPLASRRAGRWLGPTGGATFTHDTG